MKILVTGAAGYVGSVVVDALIKQGHSVVGIDNLSQGHREMVHPAAEFYKLELDNENSLNSIFQRNHFDAVCHLAAKTVISTSMTDPARYFRDNVIAGIKLLDAMRASGCNKIIFASSAAVYGSPESPTCQEDDVCTPVSPYGETKLMFEKILQWYHYAYDLKYVAFRFFNVAGARIETDSTDTEEGLSAVPVLGENHYPETHIIPCLIRSIKNKIPFKIYGNQYDTQDGTCVRDYVHVKDVANAHVLALKALDAGELTDGVFNLGCNVQSVADIVQYASNFCGRDIEAQICSPRPGDPDTLVADTTRVRKVLGWSPQHDLEDIFNDAWKWENN